MKTKPSSVKAFFLKHEALFYLLAICALSILAWYKVLNFWFFKGFEASWLMGFRHDFISLLRGHAHIYFLSFKLFGWNPTGWYLISLIFHTTASLLLFWFVYILTSKLKLAFVFALLFVANVSYEDVLTWGSFNAYYGLMLIWFLLTILSFYKYRQGKGRKYYFLSLVISFFAFLTRETGLVLLGIVPALDFLFFPLRKNRGDFLSFVKRLLPFLAVALVFLIFRASYGGVAGDFADGRVQLRTKLVSERLFLPYFWRVGLTFGKHLAAEVIPFPLLNRFRGLIGGFFLSRKFTSFYLFPLMGWGVSILMVLIAWFFRKSKKYFPLLVFSFIWIVLQTIFVSLAVPDTDETLTREYEWNTSRYHYYAFVGTVLFFGTAFYLLYLRLIKRFKRYKGKILALFVTGLVIVIGGNLYMIYKIEDHLAETIHKPARQFYSSLTSFYPILPTNYLFYQYPYTVGLNDYLYEWYFLREMFYPNLKDQPFRTENQMERVLERVKKGEHSLNDVFFLDYDSEDGLIDNISRAKKAILGQKEFSSFGEFTLDILAGSIPVEIPYQVEIRLKALPQALNAPFPLVDYTKDRYDFLTSSSASVSATMSQRPGEPFLHLLPANLIDGNFGPRSTWIADSVPAVITLDLGKIKDIKAVFWNSAKNSPRIPSTYSFYVSEDGENWQETKQRKKNTKSGRIDVFKEPVEARFVKMVIETTSQGAFASLDEIEVISSKAARVLDSYQNIDRLIEDSLQVSGLDFAWGKLTWETNKTNRLVYPQDFYFIYHPDGQFHTYTLMIPEREIFSTQGEFLKKFLTSIQFDFGKMNPNVTVDYIKLKPKYPL